MLLLVFGNPDEKFWKVSEVFGNSEFTAHKLFPKGSVPAIMLMFAEINLLYGVNSQQVAGFCRRTVA
jgi:hypothetical protein